MDSSRKSKSGSEAQFPGKLHNMMQFVEDHGLESIISWELNGYGIKINNPERLVEILPIFFGQTKYRSFRRQLNMWHFQRILEGPSKDVFVHPYFVKHDKALCAKMSRQMSLKSTLQREQECNTLASYIEPNPIQEIRYLDTKVLQINSRFQNLADSTYDFSIVQDLASAPIHDATVASLLYPSKESNKSFQPSSFTSSLSSFDHLPALPSSLPDDPTNSLDGALQTIESIISSDQQYDVTMTYNNFFAPVENSIQQDFHSGDLASFEGKRFFVLDHDSTP